MCIKCAIAEKHLNFLDWKMDHALACGATVTRYTKDIYIEKMDSSIEKIEKLHKLMNEDPELKSMVGALVLRAEETFAAYTTIQEATTVTKTRITDFLRDIMGHKDDTERPS